MPASMIYGYSTGLLGKQAAIVGRLARLETLEIVETLVERPTRALPLVAGGFEAYLTVAKPRDTAQERERLTGEIANVEQVIARSETLLAKPGFADKAPAKVVDAERAKLAANQERLERLRAQLQALAD